MQILDRDTLYYSHSRENTPSITVEPGEVFLARPELLSLIHI